MKTFTMISDRPRKFAGPGGFTLIELLLVVALVVLLAGLGGNRYVVAYKRMLVEKAAKDIYLMAKYARVLAIEKRIDCKLVLDEVGKSYFLTSGYGESESVITDRYSKPQELSGEVGFEAIEVTSTVETDQENWEGVKTVVFRSDGTADTAIIQLGDGKNHYSVYVMAATGKAKIMFGEAENVPIDIVDLDAEE
ncbi:MAG: prepilin-type N-terminal cleavage/methylation domain-containing protein [Planctomycetes bacterium]|nr:prepilin-type N-terminal cleavage/methylation domain-containing protein [Planctomycetota bacterium]